MLEGLPPNNAAYRLRLVCDERRARAVVDLIVESFEPAEAAASAFESEIGPGGRRDWIVEAYFGFEPDEDALRDLVATAAGAEGRKGSNSAARPKPTGSPIRSPASRRCGPGVS
jgi:ribosomal protein L11 methyltransferase